VTSRASPRLRLPDHGGKRSREAHSLQGHAGDPDHRGGARRFGCARHGMRKALERRLPVEAFEDRRKWRLARLSCPLKLRYGPEYI
jgi:hypothetical protein